MAAVIVCAPCLGLRFGSVSGCCVAGELVERFTRDTEDLYVVCDGRIVDSEERLEDGAVYHLEPRLRGGKGGFGSMLRALGAQIEKTTNREACRDLSGRRLRDVNHEKEMAEWLKKQSEREAEKEQRRLERIQKKLAEPKHQFTDSGFTQTCHELSERLEDSVLKGLKVDKPLSKRPHVENSDGPEVKKVRAGACSWTGLDELMSSDEDMEEDEEEAGPSSSRTSQGPSRSYCQATSSSGSTSAAEEEQGGPEEDSERPESSCRPEEQQKRPEEDQNRPEEEQEGPEEDPGRPESSCRPEEEQREPEEDQNKPEEDQNRPEEAQREPEEAQKEPEEAQREPEEAQKGPEEAQKGPEEAQKGPEEAQKEPEEAQKEPEEAQKEPEEAQSKAESTSNPSLTKAVESSSGTEPDQEQRTLDLDSVSGPEELEGLGLNRLKEELMSRGLKCGGTLSERAARLYSVKGKRPDQIDPSLLAKTNKKHK